MTRTAGVIDAKEQAARYSGEAHVLFLVFLTSARFKAAGTFLQHGTWELVRLVHHSNRDCQGERSLVY